LRIQTQNGSALHEAAFYGKFEVVSILLNYGIDVHLMNHNGRTVLDLLGELNTTLAKQIERSIQGESSADFAVLDKNSFSSFRSDHLVQAEIEAQNEQQMLDEQQVMWQCISPPPSYCDNNPLQESELVNRPLCKLISQPPPPPLTSATSVAPSAQKFSAYDGLPVQRTAQPPNPAPQPPPSSSGFSSPANSEFSYCEFVKPPSQFQPHTNESRPNGASLSSNVCDTASSSIHFHNQLQSSQAGTEHAYFTLPKKPIPDERAFVTGLNRFHG
jgi:hypothetical protein